jgi:hypothetical protein
VVTPAVPCPAVATEVSAPEVAQLPAVVVVVNMVLHPVVDPRPEDVAMDVVAVERNTALLLKVAMDAIIAILIPVAHQAPAAPVGLAVLEGHLPVPAVLIDRHLDLVPAPVPQAAAAMVIIITITITMDVAAVVTDAWVDAAVPSRRSLACPRPAMANAMGKNLLMITMLIQ